MQEAYPVAEPIPLSERGAEIMDEQEFQSLYNLTARPILAYLIGVTRRRDIADDLLQETFCRFLMRRPSAMDTNETRRYLFRIASNLLRDRWRRGEDVPCPEADEDGFDIDVDTQIDVHSALRLLKPRERELLWLAYVEGMNHEEIAAATGLRAISVRMLLFRARHKAAGLLRPERERV